MTPVNKKKKCGRETFSDAKSFFQAIKNQSVGKLQRQIRMANNNVEVIGGGAGIEGGEPGRQTLRGVINSNDDDIVLKWGQLGNGA